MATWIIKKLLPTKFLSRLAVIALSLLFSTSIYVGWGLYSPQKTIATERTYARPGGSSRFVKRFTSNILIVIWSIHLCTSILICPNMLICPSMLICSLLVSILICPSMRSQSIFCATPYSTTRRHDMPLVEQLRQSKMLFINCDSCDCGCMMLMSAF